MASHLFSQIPRAEIPRSKFNRSHSYKTTFDAGYLVPVFVDEVLPGDTFNMNSNLFCRVSTLIAPIMDDLYLDTFFFFVPERLVFEHFQRMCGEQENPDDSTDFIFPTITSPSNGFEVGSLADYFGIPTGVPNLEVRAEPFRAYNLIYNEWFRDENLQDSVPFTKADSDVVTNYSLLRRGKRHDYFTSALPWPQKGPAVDLPLSGNASLNVGPNSSITFPSTRVIAANNYDDYSIYSEGYIPVETFKVGLNNQKPYTQVLNSSLSAGSTGFKVKAISGIDVDLSSVGAVTINSLREAFQIQRWYERAARGGTRYTEILRSFFGVTSPDARLQRPEFLGGSSNRIDINVVPQTSASGDDTPQANLSAFASMSAPHINGFTKSFTEHGWIIGLVNVRANLTYQQGLNRMWTRKTKFDMYWPPFAHLGEQPIYNKEIYAQGNEQDDLVFGYQERSAEYRYYPNLITGKFRSTYAQSLDVWHLGQKFDQLPVLNEEFITDNPPVDRILAVQDEPQFLLDCYFKLNCVRPMPLYGVPGLVDHY